MRNVKQLFFNVRVVFFIAVIVLSALSIFSYVKINNLIRSSELVNHTHLVKLELEEALSYLKDAETSQRGFLLTHDSTFLEPYHSAIHNMNGSLRNLDSLTNDNPMQQANMFKLRKLVNTRIVHLEKVIYSGYSNQIRKEQLIIGRSLMSEARHQVGKMTRNEDYLLKKRTTELEKESFLTPVLYISLVISALVILVLSYYRIIEELKKSRDLQKSLIESEAYLLKANTELEKNKAQQISLKTTERFQLVADSFPQMVWTADAQGNLNYYSQSVFDTTGLTLEQINKEGWLQIVHPDDREKNIELWEHSVKTGAIFNYEHRFKRHDGEYRWQLSRALPQRDENGIIQMWVGTSTDIQDHKMFTNELEKKVRERTKALLLSTENLEKLNAELNQFAYVASHDLQEPLRKIQTFTTRIVEGEEETLTAKGKDYFERIQSAAARMQKLIVDLLSYSRANTLEKHFEAADLNLLLQTVTDQLKESITQKQATINATPLPVLEVIPFQMEQLFTNIITNALKFSKEDVAVEINIHYDKVKGAAINTVAADKNALYHHLKITDNGIGFEPEYNQRIFQVFQRLHGKGQYEGTGIGLAIVKKIIDNHNGFITATGEVNKGACFDIYLPA